MRRLWTAGVAVALALAAAPAAGAITFGPSSIGATASAIDCGEGVNGGCLFTHHTSPSGVRLAAESAGVVTRFRIVGDAPIQVRILQSSGATTYRLLRNGPTLNPSGGSNVDVFPTRFPIGVVERLGFLLPAGASASVAPGDGWAVAGVGPVPANGPNDVTFFVFPGGGFLNYNYDVEADADRDGFGDESQDRCAGSAGTDRGCRPGVLNPPPRTVTRVVQVTRPAGGAARLTASGVKLAKNRKSVAVPVSCPAGNATRCAGQVSVQTAGKVAIAAQRKKKKRRRAVVTLGKARFSLVPGASRAVSVKVSRRARRQLRGRKKLKLKIVLTESRSLTGTF